MKAKIKEFTKPAQPSDEKIDLLIRNIQAVDKTDNEYRVRAKQIDIVTKWLRDNYQQPEFDWVIQRIKQCETQLNDPEILDKNRIEIKIELLKEIQSQQPQKVDWEKGTKVLYIENKVIGNLTYPIAYYGEWDGEKAVFNPKYTGRVPETTTVRKKEYLINVSQLQQEDNTNTK